jgi:hypothetical protein
MKLPEDPWRYFKKVSGVVLVDLKKLRPTRARPGGIQNAGKYMRKAYDGEMERRKPISVSKNADGTYSVKDGNSTYANARASGWERIPAVIGESVVVVSGNLVSRRVEMSFSSRLESALSEQDSSFHRGMASGGPPKTGGAPDSPPDNADVNASVNQDLAAATAEATLYFTLGRMAPGGKVSIQRARYQVTTPPHSKAGKLFVTLSDLSSPTTDAYTLVVPSDSAILPKLIKQGSARGAVTDLTTATLKAEDIEIDEEDITERGGASMMGKGASRMAMLHMLRAKKEKEAKKKKPQAKSENEDDDDDEAELAEAKKKFGPKAKIAAQMLKKALKSGGKDLDLPQLQLAYEYASYKGGPVAKKLRAMYDAALAAKSGKQDAASAFGE